MFFPANCDRGAAYWMKGCSSLGRVRYAVLVGIGKNNQDGFALVDVKEAAKAAAPRTRNAAMPRDNAERVVQGAKTLSPYLGERMLARVSRSVIEENSVRIRPDGLTAWKMTSLTSPPRSYGASGTNIRESSRCRHRSGYSRSNRARPSRYMLLDAVWRTA